MRTLRSLHQTFIVSGDHGVHMDGAGATPVAMSPENVSIGQLCRTTSDGVCATAEPTSTLSRTGWHQV